MNAAIEVYGIGYFIGCDVCGQPQRNQKWGLVMLRMDRQLGARSAALETPWPRSTAAGPDRGALTDAVARRHYALAYRATVDAVYVMAALQPGSRLEGVGRVACTVTAKRPEALERYPDAHDRPASPPPRVEAPAEDPVGERLAPCLPDVPDQIEPIGLDPSIGTLAQADHPAIVRSSDAFHRGIAPREHRAVIAFVTCAKTPL